MFAAMRIHILSDLHKELAKYQPQQADADVIVLAGDIDKGASGIVWARQTWPDKEIVYVPGNHEYYGSSIEEANGQMEKASKSFGVHVLNPGEAIIQGVRFLGAMLWTDFNLFGAERRDTAMRVGQGSLGDFRWIEYKGKRFTPLDSTKLHERDICFLKQNLSMEFDGKTVVVTHHLPSMLSVEDRFKENILAACFASHLDELMGGSALWIHGHTHDSFDYQHPNGTRVICNPRGYMMPNGGMENSRFLPDLVVEI